jgi:hypothetical protein
LGKIKIPCFSVFIYALLPYFCAKFFHGSKKKPPRLILVIILYFYCCSDSGHCYPLALAYPAFTLCYYLLCAGYGYNVTSAPVPGKTKKTFLDIVRFLKSVTLRKHCFMESGLKQKLHLLIDNCNDEYLLEEAKAVLESNNSGKDWWDELSEEEKEEFSEGEEEHEKGHSITHHRLMHQFGEWRKK